MRKMCFFFTLIFFLFAIDFFCVKILSSLSDYKKLSSFFATGQFEKNEYETINMYKYLQMKCNEMKPLLGPEALTKLIAWCYRSSIGSKRLIW